MASSTRMYKSPSSRSKDNETQARFASLIKPKSIMCIRKGFEYFNSSHVFPSKASETFFREKRQQAQRIIAVYRLSLGVALPDSPVDKNRLWNESIRPQIGLVRDAMEYCSGFFEAGLSPTACFDSVKEWIEQLQAETASGKKDALRKQREARIRRKELGAKRLGMNEFADLDLTIRLVKVAREAIKTSLAETSGFLNFKAWVMPDGHRWYKVGVTTDLNRRDAEQNVLPVPPSTLHKVQFQHIHHAKAAERAFHGELLTMRIKGAKNKELFSLKPSQVSSVIEAMKVLGRSA